MPLWFDLEDPNRYLYHYTTRQAALGSILPTGELRVGLFRYMNDPRESKDWLFQRRRRQSVGTGFRRTQPRGDGTREIDVEDHLVHLRRSASGKRAVR